MKPIQGLAVTSVLLCFFLSTQGAQVPRDLSDVRGFNYTAASATGHGDHWLHYQPAETERELDFAKRLHLNQARVFVFYDIFRQDKESLGTNLIHFVRACHQRGIGVMVVVGCGKSNQQALNPEFRPKAAEYARFLVETLGQEPGLAFWDVANEFDIPSHAQRAGVTMSSNPAGELKQRLDFVRYMAGVFRKLDPRTPLTTGMAHVQGMEELADAVDVLSFHDYSPTREQIRANIERAKAFAVKVGKPVFNTEIGCICRANPYDVVLQEYLNAGMGWYIWELMITKSQWGPVHGVFYQDGTVRDPSIPAAILGFFRNRGPAIVPTLPDYEGGVTRTIAKANKWLAQPDGAWSDGLDLAETAANLLEAAELVPMRDPPTRQVGLMRTRPPDLPALRDLLRKYISILTPYHSKK